MVCPDMRNRNIGGPIRPGTADDFVLASFSFALIRKRGNAPELTMSTTTTGRSSMEMEMSSHFICFPSAHTSQWRVPVCSDTTMEYARPQISHSNPRACPGDCLFFPPRLKKNTNNSRIIAHFVRQSYGWCHRCGQVTEFPATVNWLTALLSSSSVLKKSERASPGG